MNLVTALAIAATWIAALIVVLAVATAARRLSRTAIGGRRAAGVAHLRPALIALIAGDDGAEVRRALDVRPSVLERAVADLLPRVRGDGYEALTRLLEERGIVDRTLRRSRHGGALARAAAAEMLGWIGLSRTLPALARLLDDPDREVVAVAARALGRLGDAAAVPFLLARLEDGMLTPGQVAGALRHIGGDAADRLAAYCSHVNPDVRLVATQVLSRIAGPTHTRVLVDALYDPVRSVRVSAAQALGRIGDPRAAPALLVALSGDDPRLRTRAAAALGEIGDESALPGLTAAVEDRDIDVSRAAAQALSAFEPEGHASLEALAGTWPTAAEALARARLGVTARQRGAVSTLALRDEIA